MARREMSPQERKLRASIAAHAQWAKETDRTARTQAAREAFKDRFLREVDPNNELPMNIRIQMAEARRREYYKRLQLKSVAARRKRAPQKPTGTPQEAA